MKEFVIAVWLKEFFESGREKKILNLLQDTFLDRNKNVNTLISYKIHHRFRRADSHCAIRDVNENLLQDLLLLNSYTFDFLYPTLG